MTDREAFRWGARLVAAGGAGAASDVVAWRGDGAPVAPLDLAADLDQLAVLAELGARSIRVTFDWARLEPEPGRRDPAPLEHLREVLAEAARLGIATWGCLHERALPGWFSVDEHGFADDRARGYFWARHVEQVGEELGSLVAGWVPTFEPNRWALQGWLTGQGPPGRLDDAEGFSGALQGVLLAGVEAALRLRGSGQPIATAHWVVPTFPARTAPDLPPTPQAEAMTTVVDAALFGCWRRLLVEGTLLVPGRAPIAVPEARAAFDVVGFTYRHALAVRADGALLPYPQQLPTGADGQVRWTEGLALSLHHVAETFGDRPLLVAGYGTAAPADVDEVVAQSRTTFEGALDDGIDLVGAWWDAPIDPHHAPQGATVR